MKSKPADLANLNIDEPNTVKSSMDVVIQGYVEALNGFEDKTVDKLPDELEQFLLHVAKTGDTLVSWDKVKKVFVMKMKSVLDEFYETSSYKAGKINSNCENDPFEEMKERLITLADDFERPPFTMQRLCELVTNPQKNYTKCEKFMRAVEKNLMVVSSWNYPSRRSSDITDQMNGSFDSRTSYNPVERPWSTLPHSPIATSPPVLPNSPKLDNVATTNLNSLEPEVTVGKNADASSTDSSINQSWKSDSKPSDDQSTPENNVRFGETASETEDIGIVSQEPEPNNDKENDENAVESNTFTEVNEQRISADDSTTNKPDTSPTPSADSYHNITETSESMITNVEKDEKKEPLPGVGTLVEKHTVITCTVGDSLPPNCEASSSKIDSLPATTELLKSSATSESAVGTAQARSPKRKLLDDEIAMEIGSPIKRSKSTEDATNVNIAESEDP